MADQRLTQEAHLTRLLTPMFAVAVLSGLGLFLPLPHGVGSQLVLLLHLVMGAAFVLVAVPYIPIHFLRSGYFRRPGLIATGLLMVAVILVLGFTGAAYITTGQREALPWLSGLHGAAGVGLLLLAVVHLADHYYRMPVARTLQYPNRYLVFKPGRAMVITLISAAVIAVLFVSNLLTKTPQPAQPMVADYSQDYGEHPFRPSQTETSHGGFVNESDIAGSENCAACHQDIARQWSESMHRQAAADPTYVTNVNLLEATKGISATRYCEGCHAPVALLTGQLSEGGKHGGIAGSLGNVEGVSCLSCHGVSRMVHLKGVASYEFTPRSRYLFEGSSNSLAVALSETLIKADPAQHVQDMASDQLGDPTLCAGCHAQFMDKDMNGWGWVKMQDEYSAWLAGPFSGHAADFTAASTQRCQDCHMPRVPGEDPSADSNGLVASHRFPGANTVIPTLREDWQQLEATVAMLQNSSMRLTIDKPTRRNAQQTLSPLDENIRGSAEAPFYAYLDENVALDVIVANQAVGHDFPGGTIDLGEAWIEFVVLDAEGDEVYASARVAEGEFLPEDAHVYKSVPTNRQGKEVWRHDLFNMVGESFRRTVSAGKADLAKYQFDIPGWVKSPLTVTATLRYRKLNERYARFALKDQYFPVPIVDIAWDSMQIPVRTRLEVEQAAQ